MPSPIFKTIANIADVPDKRPLCVALDGVSIAICKVKESVFAVSNQCTHAQATFEEGRIRGYRLVCPLHGAMFDLRSGEPNGTLAKQPLKTFPIRVDPDGSIEIDTSNLSGNAQ